MESGEGVWRRLREAGAAHAQAALWAKAESPAAHSVQPHLNRHRTEHLCPLSQASVVEL